MGNEEDLTAMLSVGFFYDGNFGSTLKRFFPARGAGLWGTVKSTRTSLDSVKKLGSSIKYGPHIVFRLRRYPLDHKEVYKHILRKRVSSFI